jgi:uncharacterized protein (DUF2267 family)
MIYETFIDEVRRQAGPMSRDEAERVIGAYMEALGERLSGETCANLALHLPDWLGARLLWGSGDGGFSVWEFHERLARKAGIAPTHAARYARQVGVVLADAVPRAELAAAREELPREYWELAERVLPDPHRDGSLEKV